MPARQQLVDVAGRAAAEVLARSMGVAVTPELMLDVRDSPSGLCRLVLDVLGAEPAGDRRVPVPLSYSAWVGAGSFPTARAAVVQERLVPVYRFRAVEDLVDPTPPRPYRIPELDDGAEG